MEYVSLIKPVKSLILAWPSFVLDEPEFTMVKLNPLAHISWLTPCPWLCVRVCARVSVCVRANRIYLACRTKGCGNWQSGWPQWETEPHSIEWTPSLCTHTHTQSEREKKKKNTERKMLENPICFVPGHGILEPHNYTPKNSWKHQA